jgi:hypothetical protein
MEKSLFAVFLREPDRLANLMGSLHCKCGLYIGNKDCGDGNLYVMWRSFVNS